MMLWIVLTAMTAVVAVLLTIPLVRAYDRPRGAATNIAILKEQLSAVDHDLAEGNLTGEQAERSRTEINRRIIAEGRVAEAPSRPLDSKRLPWVAVGVVAVVAFAATGLYSKLGRPDLPASGANSPATAGAQPAADVATMISELEAKLSQDPNNAEGWRMLGWSYLAVGRASDAVRAYTRAVALEPSNASYRSAQGDAFVQAAKGQVTPEAVEAFRAALMIDPADPRSRYYMALWEDQQGQRNRAMADWIALIKSAPADAPWLGQVREFVERVARDRHIDISKELGPPAPQPTAAPQPGPTKQQIEQAQQMSPSERETMIRSMVDKLASDLKANPRNEAGWAQLMRARMVLGQPAAASAAYRDAQKVFADTPSTLASLRGQAKALGVPGA